MEVVKYICEFFFGNFWHWLELALLLSVIVVRPTITIKSKRVEEEK